MKKCSACGEEKDLDLFAKNKLGKMGRHSQCRSCQNERIKQRYYGDLEQNREVKKQNAKKVRQRRKARGEKTYNFNKWMNVKSDLIDRVTNLLKRSSQSRAKSICYGILYSDQERWRRFRTSFEGDEILSNILEI